MDNKAKIAVIIEDMFEDPEYEKPAEAFEKEGHEIVHVGLKKGKKVKGKRGEAEAEIDKAFSEVKAEDFDALFIPGGYSPDKLRAHKEAVEFVKNFAKTGKPIFAICHAPQILISAGVVKGRKLTGWKSIKQDIINAGAEYMDKEVVIDENLISSRQPDDIPAFIDAALRKLEET
jgi:protease I